MIVLVEFFLGCLTSFIFLLSIIVEIVKYLQDEELSFIPSISLPSNALSFALKRRISPNNKLRLEDPRYI